MLKTLRVTLLLGTGLALTAGSALALQTTVTQVDKNSNGTTTYHFAIQLDPGETLIPGASKADADFVTVYNFYGLVDGVVKSPAGWEFYSENSGRTPMLNGYPLVLPVDVPNTPNLTWTVTKPVAAGARIEGFTATTRVGTMVQGEYGHSRRTSLPPSEAPRPKRPPLRRWQPNRRSLVCSRRPASSPTSSSNLAATMVSCMAAITVATDGDAIMTLNGKRIVVLGGSSGIGLATAQAAAREGASVVVAYLAQLASSRGWTKP